MLGENMLYLAPELLMGSAVPSKAADVYAFGILVAEGGTFPSNFFRVDGCSSRVTP